MDEEGDIPVGKMKKSTIWRCILCILALPLSSGRHHSVAETYYQDVDLLQRSRPIIQNSKERRQYSPINTSYNEDGATSDEVCLANFQLNADTIIRTQDSRIMGAKYINETELPSKDQCLLWCCQVNGCNVIVFEEKDKGSCYLFDCGPSNDFKCKFTSHRKYTSAILDTTMMVYNRHRSHNDRGEGNNGATGNTWNSNDEHITALKNLKHQTMPFKDVVIGNEPAVTPMGLRITADPRQHQESENVSDEGGGGGGGGRATTTFSSSSSMSTTATTTLRPDSEILAGDALKSSAPPIDRLPVQQGNGAGVNGCTHFQFQCRTTRECIAVYNACDGIPQCGDGSDEGEDLGCPPDGRRYSGSAATPASLQTQQHQRPAVQSSTFFSSHPKVQNDGNGQHSSLNVGSQKIHQSLSRPNPQSYHLSPQQQSQQYDHSQRLSEFESEDSQPSTSTILPLEDKVPKGDSPQSSATNDDSGHKQSSSGSRQKAMSNSSGSDGRGYAMTAENSGGHLRFPGGGGSIRNDGTDDSFYSAIPETHSSKGRPQGSSNLDHQYSPEFQMSVPGLNSLQENNKDSSATSIVDDSPYGDRHTMDNPETNDYKLHRPLYDDHHGQNNQIPERASESELLDHNRPPPLRSHDHKGDYAPNFNTDYGSNINTHQHPKQHYVMGADDPYVTVQDPLYSRHSAGDVAQPPPSVENHDQNVDWTSSHQSAYEDSYSRKNQNSGPIHQPVNLHMHRYPVGRPGLADNNDPRGAGGSRQGYDKNVDGSSVPNQEDDNRFWRLDDTTDHMQTMKKPAITQSAPEDSGRNSNSDDELQSQYRNHHQHHHLKTPQNIPEVEDHAPSKSHSGSSYVSTNTSVKSEMAIINHNNNNNNNGVGQKTLVDHQVTTITTTTAKLASKPQSQVEVNLAQVDVDRTERASEASGAILALTLGLSITGLLLVLVGCRLRMVHRRLRRGRSPFAHDADYLVNGMYL